MEQAKSFVLKVNEALSTNGGDKSIEHVLIFRYSVLQGPGLCTYPAQLYARIKFPAYHGH